MNCFGNYFLKYRGQLHSLKQNEGLSHDHLYNYAKTRLNFIKLPSKTVASCKERSAPGYKLSKELMMLPACY
jgi:hypothetical protein